MISVNRLAPKLPSRMYKTFQIASPLATHYRVATCAEVECEAYTKGWTYKKADLIAENLLYLVTHAGKRYRETSIDEGGEIYLVFEPGQVCFQARAHRVSLERPELYLSGRGDYRSYSARNANRYDRADQWVESFAEHQEIINRVIQEGF
jgi:hypothetical protein